MTLTKPVNDPLEDDITVKNTAGYVYVGSGGGAGSGGLAVLGADSNALVTDINGVKYAYPQFKLASGPNRGNQAAIWTAAAVLAAGVSPDTRLFGAWGKCQLYASASAATNLTVQVSPDGTTWYTLTQDNAGTAWTLALTAGMLAAARDLPGILSDHFRLVSSAAATITAGVLNVGI